MTGKWQARRDSNPQHPVLETGALAIRATGLQATYPCDRIARPPNALFRFAVRCMLLTKTAVFAELQLVRCVLLVLGRRIVALLALGASQRHDIAHDSNPRRPGRRRLYIISANYSMISLTTPAPTVRPPSRIAKRSSLSMAIGVIRSTVMPMLSPGMTISVPSGSSTIPVTSVVRK